MVRPEAAVPGRASLRPMGAAEKIRALIPALDDLNLRRRLAVKEYDAVLTDMNAQHIDRLDAAQVAAFNRVFSTRREDLGYFGYSLMGQAAEAPRRAQRQRRPVHLRYSASSRGCKQASRSTRTRLISFMVRSVG